MSRLLCIHRTALLVTFISLAPPALAYEPAEWLLRMSESARASNYQGTMIYRGDELLETFRVTHRFENGQERERVHSLTGEVREVLKHDDKVVCILPRDRRMSVDRPTPKGLFPGLTAERLKQLGALYELRDLGEARVAGRSCRGLAIVPRDGFRYGYEIWADEATAVPLKVSLLGRDSRILEQMFFSEVEFPATIPDRAFETELDPAQKRLATQNAAPTISAVARAVADDKAQAEKLAQQRIEERRQQVAGKLEMGQLPPGFRLVMRKQRPLPDGRGMVEHLLLTDGLTAVSVFRTEERAPPQNSFRGISQMGAVHAYGRVVGRMHITVVGEAPRETVQMIGDSLRAEGPVVELPESPEDTATH